MPGKFDVSIEETLIEEYVTNMRERERESIRTNNSQVILLNFCILQIVFFITCTISDNLLLLILYIVIQREH